MYRTIADTMRPGRRTATTLPRHFSDAAALSCVQLPHRCHTMQPSYPKIPLCVPVVSTLKFGGRGGDETVKACDCLVQLAKILPSTATRVTSISVSLTGTM